MLMDMFLECHLYKIVVWTDLWHIRPWHFVCWSSTFADNRLLFMYLLVDSVFPSDFSRMLLSVRKDLECAFKIHIFHFARQHIYSLSAKAFEDSVEVPYLGTFFFLLAYSFQWITYIYIYMKFVGFFLTFLSTFWVPVIFNLFWEITVHF